MRSCRLRRTSWAHSKRFRRHPSASVAPFSPARNILHRSFAPALARCGHPVARWPRALGPPLRLLSAALFRAASRCAVLPLAWGVSPSCGASAIIRLRRRCYSHTRGTPQQRHEHDVSSLRLRASSTTLRYVPRVMPGTLATPVGELEPRCSVADRSEAEGTLLGDHPQSTHIQSASMDLATAKQRLRETEALLAEGPLAEFTIFETPHGPLRVMVTARLRRKCRKGRVWMSTPMLTALKNAAYGFDALASRSRGGSDGVFAVDPGFKPANSMMKKLFDQFLNKPDSLVADIAAHVGVKPTGWRAVRVVSHHMRLLGVLIAATPPTLVLVDFDNDKH